MPNWVTNKVTISGKHADVDAALAKLVNAEGEVDFNLAVPKPETLDIEVGTYTDVGLWLLGGEDKYGNSSMHAHDFANVPFKRTEKEKADALTELCVARPPRSAAEMTALLVEVNSPSKTREELLELLKDHESVKNARTYLENVKLYGHGDWYSWSCAKWGTKWNADWFSAVETTAVTKNTKRCKVTFTTAWAPPDPVLRAVAAAAPGVKVKNSWQDEGGPKGVDMFCELTAAEEAHLQDVTQAAAARTEAALSEDEIVDILRSSIR
jgi:hypothetical protein